MVSPMSDCIKTRLHYPYGNFETPTFQVGRGATAQKLTVNHQTPTYPKTDAWAKTTSNPSTSQPWPIGHAIAFNLPTLAYWPRNRVQPPNLGLLATQSRSTSQPWPIGHAIAFNLLTLAYWPRNRVQPPNLPKPIACETQSIEPTKIYISKFRSSGNNSVIDCLPKSLQFSRDNLL
ncbi:hypothetical protein [Moorena sp. SIO4G3]|uniref:hypothetical protein n=1 Tax=Moorena sp. SIO4G3 TaxID=2607821 RepID=UPI001428E8F0|nr:hypothetical protein [Moorena sp. SIO4G3]NEO78431.1 hypothetical protein [Moorena sp. SIO4G3]